MVMWSLRQIGNWERRVKRMKFWAQDRLEDGNMGYEVSEKLWGQIKSYWTVAHLKKQGEDIHMHLICWGKSEEMKAVVVVKSLKEREKTELRKTQISSLSFFLSTLPLYLFSVNAFIDTKFMDYKLMYVKLNTHLQVLFPKKYVFKKQYVFKKLRKKSNIFLHGSMPNFS